MELIIPFIWLILLVFYIKKFLKNQIFSFSGFFLINFWLCYFGGTILGKLLGLNLNYILIILYPSLFLLFFLLFQTVLILNFGFPNINLRINQYIKSINLKHLKLLGYVLLIILLIAILIIFIKNKGVTVLEINNYTERFLLNTNNGILMLLLNLYPFIGIFFLLSKPSIKRFIFIFFFLIFLGFIAFIVTGGIRNLIAFSIISYLGVAFYLRIINYSKLIVILLIIIAFINILAFLRYKISFEEINIYYFLHYLMDSISPITSLNIILEKVPKIVDYIYFTYFHNYFLAFVPRFLWPDKPILMQTSALFFTKEILHYSRNLIISPTFIGEIYMMGGIYFIILGAILLANLLYFLDKFLSKKNIILYLASFPLVFWLGRGIIETFLYRLILIFLAFIFLKALYYLLSNFIKRKIYN